MHCSGRPLHSGLPRGFLRREDGNASIEFVLWLPFMLFLLLVIVQLSFIFLTISVQRHVVTETARLVARHEMDAVTAEAFVKDKATVFGTAPTVVVDLTPYEARIGVSIPAAAVVGINPLGLVDGQSFGWIAQQTMEPI